VWDGQTHREYASNANLSSNVVRQREDMGYHPSAHGGQAHGSKSSPSSNYHRPPDDALVASHGCHSSEHESRDV
jgi:hypothetical protein